jgi:hypothetical protein
MSVSIVRKIDRFQLFEALAAEGQKPLQVYLAAVPFPILVVVTKVEREDGSGFLFNVGGWIVGADRGESKIELFVNTKPDAESFGCQLRS